MGRRLFLLVLAACACGSVYSQRTSRVETGVAVSRTVLTPSEEGMSVDDQLNAERQMYHEAELRRQQTADSLAARQKEVKDSLALARKEARKKIPWTNVVMVNGSYAIYPDWAVGLTYARVKVGGYYVSLMSNFGFRFQGDYVSDASGRIGDITPFYANNSESARLTALAGGMARVVVPVYVYAGAGYGYRQLYDEMVGGRWASRNTLSSPGNGLGWEAGVMGNIHGFCISAGVLGITDFNGLYLEAKIGIGYGF